MMKTHILLPIIALLALPAIAQPARNSVSAQGASAPGSVWSMNVVGLKGESLGTVTLELSDENVWTCAGSQWKKTRILQRSFQSPVKHFETKDYFPTYRADGETLTFQLNPSDLCDAYIFLSGKFTEREGKGDYFSSGLLGARPLGTFTAKKLQR